MFVLQASLFLAVIVLIEETHGKVISLPFGDIEGTTSKSYRNQRTIYQYQGIPFAKPPVGDLRFKRPERWNETWEGTREFLDFGDICPQGIGVSIPIDFQHKADVNQSEDCLTLNVYTTKTEDGGNTTGRPVMVFVHGGALRAGSARHYEPNYLLDKDIVLVVPQYRLGILGFLSLNTDDIPGNQGLHDTLLALEWVQENIEHFGGDPSAVTIFGQSAGAAVITSMLFSPLVRDGLFQRVIAQSGSVLGTWATDPDPVPHTKSIGFYAGCIRTEETVLTECLKKRTTQDLLRAHTLYLIQDVTLGGRAVGGNHIVFNEAGENSFIRDDPFVLLKKGKYKKVPMLAGVTKHEASGFFGVGWDLLINPLKLYNNTKYLKRNATRQVLEYGGVVDQTGYVVSFMQDKYFNEEELGDFTLMTPGLIDILSVSLLKACTFTMANAMSSFTDSYMYSFNFFGRHSTFPSDEVSHYPFKGGIAHSDELFYLFPLGRELDEKEDAIAKKMVDIWTNFAIDGVPKSDGVPNWPVMSTTEGPYLQIDNVPKVYASFTKKEYMITVVEGLTEPSSAGTISTAIFTLLCSLVVYVARMY